MAQYDEREEEKKRLAKETQVDDDGFTKVVSGITRTPDGLTIRGARRPSLKTGAFGESTEQTAAPTGKKMKSKKSKEMPDFYRFQLREKRRDELIDHRKRNRKDLETVKQMKKAQRTCGSIWQSYTTTALPRALSSLSLSLFLSLFLSLLFFLFLLWLEPERPNASKRRQRETTDKSGLSGSLRRLCLKYNDCKRYREVRFQQVQDMPARAICNTFGVDFTDKTTGRPKLAAGCSLGYVSLVAM